MSTSTHVHVERAASLETEGARKVRLVAEKHRPKLARRVLDALEASKDKIDVTALALLLASGNKEQVASFMLRADFVGQEVRAAEETSSPIAEALLDVAQDAGNATQCAYGGPVSKTAAKKAVTSITQSQADEIWTKHLAGVKSKVLGQEYGLTSSQLTTVLYKQEVNAFPVPKLSSIWNDIKGGMLDKDLQTKYDLSLSQIKMVASKVKSSSTLIKEAILKAPVVEAPAAVTSIPGKAATYADTFVAKPSPGAKTASWTAGHPSGKPFEQFWLEKKQYHSFTDAEIAWNLQVSEADLAAIYQKGAQQQLAYVTPKTTYKAPYTPPAPKPVFDPSLVKQTPPGEWPIAPDVVRKAGENYPDLVTSAFKKWEASLTTQEKYAVRKYTGSAYQNINRALWDSPSLDADARLIQKAIDKGKQLGIPPPPELVWRAVGNSGAEAFVKKMASGDVIELEGFQSSSIDPAFGSTWGSGRLVFEIKPVRGVYVESITQNKGESEFLMPTHAKYRVRGQQTIKYGTGYGEAEKTVIQLEMLP